LSPLCIFVHSFLLTVTFFFTIWCPNVCHSATFSFQATSIQ
jgi:hypothetical protein